MNYFGITITIKDKDGYFYGKKYMEWVDIDKENQNYKKMDADNKKKLIFKLRPLYSNYLTNYEINKRIFSILVLLKNESMNIHNDIKNPNMSRVYNDSFRRIAFGHLAHKYAIPIDNHIFVLIPMLLSFIGNIPNKISNSLNNWQTAYDDLYGFYNTNILENKNQEFIVEKEKLKSDLKQEIQEVIQTK